MTRRTHGMPVILRAFRELISQETARTNAAEASAKLRKRRDEGKRSARTRRHCILRSRRDEVPARAALPRGVPRALAEDSEADLASGTLPCSLYRLRSAFRGLHAASPGLGPVDSVSRGDSGRCRRSCRTPSIGARLSITGARATQPRPGRLGTVTRSASSRAAFRRQRPPTDALLERPLPATPALTTSAESGDLCKFAAGGSNIDKRRRLSRSTQRVDIRGSSLGDQRG